MSHGLPENPRKPHLLNAGVKVRVLRGPDNHANKTGTVMYNNAPNNFYLHVLLDGDHDGTLLRRDEVTPISAVELLADLADG